MCYICARMKFLVVERLEKRGHVYTKTTGDKLAELFPKGRLCGNELKRRAQALKRQNKRED